MVESIRDEISRKNFDKNKFIRLTLESEAARDEIVKLVLTDRAIMVYYNCYYVLSEASSRRPECFMPYWDDFAGLLHHKNSYHRDIGVTLLANLVGADKAHAFQEELLKSEILLLVDQMYDELQGENVKRADFFILDCLKSISPKTRNLGKAITKRRNIEETRL